MARLANARHQLTFVRINKSIFRFLFRSKEKMQKLFFPTIFSILFGSILLPFVDLVDKAKENNEIVSYFSSP